MTMETDMFSTPKFYLAVWLSMNGCEIKEIDSTEPDMVKFIFDKTPELMKFERDFFSNAELQRFIAYIQELRPLLHPKRDRV